MDCWDVYSGFMPGGFINKSRVPTEADKSTTTRIRSIGVEYYPSFAARFAEAHKLLWFNKATCKNVLDHDVQDPLMKVVSHPAETSKLKNKQSVNNHKRPSAEEVRQRQLDRTRAEQEKDIAQQEKGNKKRPRSGTVVQDDEDGQEQPRHKKTTTTAGSRGVADNQSRPKRQRKSRTRSNNNNEMQDFMESRHGFPSVDPAGFLPRTRPDSALQIGNAHMTAAMSNTMSNGGSPDPPASSVPRQHSQ